MFTVQKKRVLVLSDLVRGGWNISSPWSVSKDNATNIENTTGANTDFLSFYKACMGSIERIYWSTARTSEVQQAVTATLDCSYIYADQFHWALTHFVMTYQSGRIPKWEVQKSVTDCIPKLTPEERNIIEKSIQRKSDGEIIWLGGTGDLMAQREELLSRYFSKI